jgi:undecaprenyl-diphosphatase
VSILNGLISAWRRLAPSQRWIVATLVVIIVLALGFLGLADEVGEGDTQPFDRAVLMVFRSPENPADPIGPPWLAEAARDLTALGSFSVLGLAFLIVIGYLLIAGKRGVAAWVAVTVLGGSLLSTLLKLHYDRPRPDLGAVLPVFTSSFPSGHALISTVVYLTLGAMLARSTRSWRLRIFYVSLAVALALLIGLTRIYLGVHFPTDVLAGWAMGAAWAGICFVASLVLAPRLDRNASDD